jgi:hypothetical protein
MEKETAVHFLTFILESKIEIKCEGPRVAFQQNASERTCLRELYLRLQGEKTTFLIEIPHE